jgi:hypothetical protein
MFKDNIVLILGSPLVMQLLIWTGKSILNLELKLWQFYTLCPSQ